MTPLFLRSGAESKPPDLIMLFLYLYLFSNCLLWNISFPSYWYRCWVLPLSHFITTFVIFHFITRFMAYTLTVSFSFDHIMSIFFTVNFIHLHSLLFYQSSWVSIKQTPFFTFFKHHHEAGSASFLPRQPSYWVYEATDRPPFCILCLHHFCLILV